MLCTAKLAGVYRVAGEADQFCDMVALGRAMAGSPPLLFIHRDNFGDYSPGRWIWWLTDIEPAPPRSLAKGHQKLWEWRP